MKFSLSLLKDQLDTHADLYSLTEALTQLGLEVEGVENPASGLHIFEVAEILEAARHPDAEKLQVCKVRSAGGELQIVCGAPNARAGIKVVLAPVGAIVPVNGMEIKKSKIRGVESQGMLCSARELGLGHEDAGIMELPASVEIGASIVDVLGLSDPIIELSITANRGDCMSVRGIARELAAKGLGTLRQLPSTPIATQGVSDVQLRIEDPFCRAFWGRTVRGVQNGPSPEWLAQALTRAGMRPISALVDITNYMTLAYGRPLHVYDLAKLSGDTLTARAAREGESLAALNDKTYTLTPDMGVIADASGPLGLGGIIGGASTGVSDATTDVFIECALFDAISIGKTGRALMVDSDARTRFERGVDPAFLREGLEIATGLVLTLCGGSASEIIEAGSIPEAATPIQFDPASINALGGTSLSPKAMEKALTALGFAVEGAHATPPSWRHDITIPQDLAEEVLRLNGYDAIPAVSLPKPDVLPARAMSESGLRASRCRRLLATRGLHEAQSWGFFSAQDAQHFGAQDAGLHLRNPISSELSQMRTSLLPHLVRAVANNQARSLPDVALFEIGAVFSPALALRQEPVAALVRAGSTQPLHWQGGRESDIFTAKADVEALLAECGLDTAKVTWTTESLPAHYHPGRSARLMLGPKTCLGYVGELHPRVLEAYGITGRAVACELFLERIPKAKQGKRKALRVSDYQPVTRDFAFVVDASLPAATLLKAANAADPALVRQVALFDVYQGKGLEEGKKSLGLRLTLQADDRTLTDAEIDVVSQSLIRAVADLGGVLR